MRCPSCGFENPEGMKFCIKCATPLSQRCTECGFINPPESAFCGQCSASFTKKREEKGKLQGTSQAKSEAPEAERRHLTVMFCDLVGSTALSEQLDPEDLRDVMHNYQKVCGDVISRHEGYIAKYLGDGVLVYFGFPIAHEDDAQRAVRSGLEIIDEIVKLSDSLQSEIKVRLAVRVGIHTGLVVVGEMGAGDVREKMAIVGETPNIAARLQELAEINSVVISTITKRLIQGFFEFWELGPHTLKGLSQPMEIYKVLKESGVKSRLEVAITKGLTPLVGREQEMEFLLERWEKVKEGMGQVLLLSGEGGIGKSRLLHVLKEHMEGQPYTRIESRCSPYFQNSSLYPVINHLEELLEFRRDYSPDEKLARLEGLLVQYGFSLEETVPLFASLLSIPIPERYPPLNLTPERQKKKTLEAFLFLLLKEAEKQPVVRIVEDLHWVDPSTLEYLSLLVEQVPTARIFILFTFRPDFSPPWAMRSYMTQIILNRLSGKQVELMVKRLSGGKTLPEEIVQQVVAKTDGVPLFVEELTKMVLESGMLRERDEYYISSGTLPPLSIPTTLQDSLMARLDRLTTVKEVAQLGATLGKDFTYELIRAVSPLPEETLQRELGKLVEAELLYQRGIPPQARYFFKHTMIQEAAYESLLKKTRQKYHRKIAEVLEDQFPEIPETQPELLAHHYTESGLIVKAIPLWQKAGQRAIELSANVEAISHLTKGLELLKISPDTPERAQQELALQITLSVPLTVTKGYAAPEVGRVYTRARELCQHAGETTMLVAVSRGLAQFYRVKGELKTARKLAEELLTLAQNIQNPSFLLEAHLALGEILFWLGEFSNALDHVKQGSALYNPQEHRSHAFRYVQDPGMGCCGYAAWTMWLLGYHDQAIEKSYETMTLATECSHPYSLAIAHVFSSWIHQFNRESRLTQELADKLIKLSSEQGFSQWFALGSIMRGWALVDQEVYGEGIEYMMSGIAGRRARESEVGRTYFLALLAEGYGKVGQTKEGITVLTEALDTAQKTGECFYESELHRLYGELLLHTFFENQTVGPFDRTQDSVQAEAEDNFLKAIGIARRQGAKSLELRAVTSLGYLLKNQGRKKEAEKMLTDIYGWFTEGFNTKDLKEAKALLEELT